MYRISMAILLGLLVLAGSCAQGVPVPADFPVKISLPAGSEISDSSMLNDAMKAMPGSKVVQFSCAGGTDKVMKHIEGQLKNVGYSKMVVPGMPDTGQKMYTKEGSSLTVSVSQMPGSDEYMLMAMEMPKMPVFGH